MSDSNSTAAERFAGDSGFARLSPRVVCILYLVSFVIAVLLPWLILGIQEKIRYGQNPQYLWPWITMLTPLHLAALMGVLFLSNHPAIRRSSQHFSSFKRFDVRYTVASVAVILLVVPASLHFISYYTKLLWFEPISPFNGDMLPLIEMSLRDFWAVHRYPYHFYDVAHWQIPLTYFPGVWLPFSVPWLLGLDIRILCIVAFGLMVLVMIFQALIRLRQGINPINLLEILPLILIPYFLFLIPAFRGFLPALHVVPFWLFIVCWGVFFGRRYWFMSGVFLGLCVVSRPYMVAVGPFFLIWCLWNWRENHRAVLSHCAGAAIIAFVLGAPFFFQDPKAFLYGVLEWYDYASKFHLEGERWRTHGFGFSGILWELSGASLSPDREYHGIFAHRMTVAWVFEFGLLAAVWKRLRSPDQLLRTAAVAIFIMLYFTVIPFFYTFACPLILLALSQVTIPSKSLENNSPLADKTILAILALPVTLLLLVAAISLRNKESTIPSTMIDNAEMSLLYQVKPLEGFEQQGWFPANMNQEHRLVGPNAYMGLPAGEESSPALKVDYGIEETIPDAMLKIHLNGEAIGEIPLATRPDNIPSFSLPRMNLFRGTNMLRFEVHRNGNWLSAEEVQKANIRIRHLQLEPPPPLLMNLTH